MTHIFSIIQFRGRLILVIFLLGVIFTLSIYLIRINHTISIHFRNVTKEMGLSKSISTNGASWVDYDNDDDLDLFWAGPTRFYRNDGKKGFMDVTREAGLDSNTDSMAGIFADFDNDGCADLYIVNYGKAANLNDNGEPDILYRNNCNGTFTDVTKSAGIWDQAHGSSAVWADVDNDGYVDLYVANYGNVHDATHYTSESNILYHNNGNGTFTNITDKAGVSGFIGCYRPSHRFKDRKPSFQPIFLDYDNDGKTDLFISTDSGVSPLYHNLGNGVFKDVTKESGLCVPGSGMGVTAGDYDNDGYLDLYVTNAKENYLWHNDGKGTFLEVAEKLRVADNQAVGWGTHFFDFDNDGDLDLYVANGATFDRMKTDEERKRSSLDVFFENDGQAQFTSISDKVGVVNDEIKRPAAFADYDNDGFVDILLATSNADYYKLGSSKKTKNSDKKIPNFLYHNGGNSNHWLTIKLIGTKSNRDGIGAKIKVETSDKTQIQQAINSSSFQSQNSPWLNFGLTKNTVINKIEISWPSGKVQTLQNIKSNQRITIKEN